MVAMRGANSDSSARGRAEGLGDLVQDEQPGLAGPLQGVLHDREGDAL